MSETNSNPSRVKVWLLASRPKTLWAALCPVVIGATIAVDDGYWHAYSFIAAMLGALFIQIGTNFANDLFDFKKSTDTEERLGPLRMTQAGLVTPSQMRNATIIAFSLAFVIGIYLVYRGGWPIVAIGVTSILFGVLYTGGPFPLGYNGLGELFVLIFFGPVAVGGTYFVMSGIYSQESVVLGCSPGLLSSAILVVNNLRDIETDKKTGKRTLAVRFGRLFSRIEYLVLMVVAIVIPTVWSLASDEHRVVPMTLAAFVPAVAVSRIVLTSEGKPLNSALAGTGFVLAVFTVLFAIGWTL